VLLPPETPKSSKRKRNYRQSANCCKANENALKVMLPYS
jgi:ribosomal protein L35